MTKKGLVVIEFIIALGIFISAFIFVILSINQRVPLLNEANIYNDIVSDSYEISNVALFSNEIGFSNGTGYFISETKLNTLNNDCGLTPDINELIEFRRYFSETDLNEGIDKLVYLNVYRLSSTNQWLQEWNCGNPDTVDDYAVKTVVERFAVLNTDKSILRLRFTVIE